MYNSDSIDHTVCIAVPQLLSFGEPVVGRSLDLVFRSRSDLLDASSLIIHYLSYLPSGQTDESFRISQFLHDTLPQFIDVPTMTESASRHQQGVSAGAYVFSRYYISNSY